VVLAASASEVATRIPASCAFLIEFAIDVGSSGETAIAEYP